MFNNQLDRAERANERLSPSVVDTAKHRHADRLIEFWLRAFVAFILALAVVTLYYVVRHN